MRDDEVLDAWAGGQQLLVDRLRGQPEMISIEVVGVDEAVAHVGAGPFENRLQSAVEGALGDG